MYVGVPEFTLDSVDIFETYYEFSMQLSRSLWYTFMKPELIVGDGRLWTRSGWIFLGNHILNCVFQQFVLLLLLLCDVLFIFIGNISVFHVVVHSIDVIIWVKKSDWIHFKYLSYKCGFEGTWDLCINFFVQVFWYWFLFVIVMK